MHCHFVPPHRRLRSLEQHRLPRFLIALTSYLSQHASWTWRISITAMLSLPHALDIELG